MPPCSCRNRQPPALEKLRSGTIIVRTHTRKCTHTHTYTHTHTHTPTHAHPSTRAQAHKFLAGLAPVHAVLRAGEAVTAILMAAPNSSIGRQLARGAMVAASGASRGAVAGRAGLRALHQSAVVAQVWGACVGRGAVCAHTGGWPQAA